MTENDRCSYEKWNGIHGMSSSRSRERKKNHPHIQWVLWNGRKMQPNDIINTLESICRNEQVNGGEREWKDKDRTRGRRMKQFFFKRNKKRNRFIVNIILLYSLFLSSLFCIHHRIACACATHFILSASCCSQQFSFLCDVCTLYSISLVTMSILLAIYQKSFECVSFPLASARCSFRWPKKTCLYP